MISPTPIKLKGKCQCLRPVPRSLQHASIPAGSGMHYRFAGSLPQGIKFLAIVFPQIISNKWLSSIFIYPLQNLPARQINSTIPDQNGCPKMRTLYPAAYPRPGKREVNLRATEAEAYSLKITLFRVDTEVIFNSGQM
jgi:hypothetical protein